MKHTPLAPSTTPRRTGIFRPVAVAACLGLLVTACSRPAEDPDAATPAASQASPESASALAGQTRQAGKDKGNGASKDKVVAAYREVLDNPEAFPFASSNDLQPTGDYNYALADADGDGTPELLLEQERRFGEYNEISGVQVITFDPASGKAVAARYMGNGRVVPEELALGAASAGGSRAQLYGTTDGTGIIQALGYSGTGVYSATNLSLRDGALTVEGPFWDDYTVTAEPADLVSARTELTWTPTTDGGQLEGLTVGGGTGLPSSQERTTQAIAAAKRTFPNFAADYLGTSGDPTVPHNTSDEFAQDVYRQFIRAYAANGLTDTTVTATSPVTNQSYTLTCEGTITLFGPTPLVECTGGNQAVVYIGITTDPTVTPPTRLQQGANVSI